jgi:hypothetical protein
MFLRWDANCVVVKYGWDKIHVEKGFWDPTYAQRLVL